MWKTALTLLPVALVGFAPVASATTVKNLEFDTNGVLPSAEPDIEFFNSSAQTEASLYAVNGGFLEQTTFGIGTGNASYGFPDNTVTGGGLDPALATIIEARLSISQIEGLGGVIFQVFDGGNRYTVRFDAGGANVQSNSGNVFVPIASLSSSHTYRIESPGSSDELRFFVDDILELTTTAPSSLLMTARKNNHKNARSTNGPTPVHTKPPTGTPPICRNGSTTTIGTDPMAG